MAAVIRVRYLLASRRRAQGREVELRDELRAVGRGGQGRRGRGEVTAAAPRLRLPRQHLPLADRRGGDAASDRRGRSGGAHRGRERRHRLRGTPVSRPTPAAAAEARSRGIVMDGTARQLAAADLARLDMILAMDESNAADLRAWRPTRLPRPVRLLREVRSAARGDLSVPDPYYGGASGFTDVFDMVDAACRGLLEHLQGGPPGRARVSLDALAARPARPAALGAAACGAEPVGGGSINQAARVALGDGRTILRQAPDGRGSGGRSPRPPGARLARRGGGAAHARGARRGRRGWRARFLALSGSRRGAPGPGSARRSSAAPSPPSTAPGRRRSASTTTTSSAPCPSRTPCRRRGRRSTATADLEPLATRAAATAWPRGVPPRLERLRARLPELAGPPEPPARLHGDLWSGNASSCAGGRPWSTPRPTAATASRPRDDAPLRRLPGGRPRRLRRSTPSPTGHEIRRTELLPLRRSWCTCACSAAATPARRSGSWPATPHRRRRVGRRGRAQTWGPPGACRAGPTTSAPSSEKPTSTQSAVCMLWMKGCQLVRERPVVRPRRS